MRRFIEGDLIFNNRVAQLGIVFLEDYSTGNSSQDGVWIMYHQEVKDFAFPFEDLQHLKRFDKTKKFTQEQLDNIELLFKDNNCNAYSYESIDRFTNLLFITNDSLTNIRSLNVILDSLNKEIKY